MDTAACCMLVSTFCMAAGIAPALAQSTAAQRYPLNTDAIARALHNDGLDVHPADMRMPMTLSAAVSDPALELVGADRLPDGNLRLRLRCRHTGDCLPFSLTLAHNTPAPVLLASALGASATAIAGSTGTTLAQPHVAPLSTPETALSVRPGTRLTMLMEDGHMHIHLPVVSLDSAPRDGEIRVATLDRKHTYRATVVNEATVRGIME